MQSIRVPHVLLVLKAIVVCAIPGITYAQSIWSGLDVAFSKAPFADPTEASSQDRITDQVWITRQTKQGIYNIRQEPFYIADFSPADTEWAFEGLNFNPDTVSAEAYSSLNFSDWKTALGGQGALVNNILNRPGVVHLITDDIYIDIQFTAWGQSGEGGEVAYLRGAPPATSVEVAGVVTDTQLFLAACRNAATGQTVFTQSVTSDGSWNCTANGLEVESGDGVLKLLRGQAVCDAGPCEISGDMSGVQATTVICRNVSTAQSVFVAPTANTFDCVDAGLSVQDQQFLQVVIFSTALPTGPGILELSFDDPVAGFHDEITVHGVVVDAVEAQPREMQGVIVNSH